ncbi:NEW3 domain-containing protein [Candidatus Latescibacterota bacterium]
MTASVLLAVLALGTVSSGWPSAAAAQSLTREQRQAKLSLEEKLRQLEAREATLATQKEELDTTRELLDMGYVALQTYRRTENNYEEALLKKEQAEIQLEETKLNLLKGATRMVVRAARKYKSADGKSMVDITLQNASDIRDAQLVDSLLTEDELRSLLRVENIYVSLERGPVVGEPYEARIPSLGVGQSHVLTYRLLRDEEAVVVVLNYLDIEDQAIPVILRKGSDQELPSINSAQFSQTGELQQDVGFDLTLERLSDDERSFGLAVLGLPQRIEHSFVDGGAKVSQVKFDETKSKANLSLQLEIPEKLDRRFIGRTRTFYALVTEPSEYGRINALRTRFGDDPLPEAEVKELRANYVKLELIPKGIGKLEVLVSNRYQEIKVEDDLRIRVEFLNRGTVAVQNVKAALDLPYEWQSEVDPSLIKILQPDERAPVTIAAAPPSDIAVGNYELGIEAQGQVGNENIESLEKNITIHVGARSNVAGNTILIGILVFLVVGIGVASVRISRR